MTPTRQLLTVAAVFLGAYFLLPALGLPMAGPLAVLLATATALATQRARGASWAEFGLARPPRPWRLPWQALGLAVLGYGVAAAAMLAAVKGLGWAPVRPDRLAMVQGHLPALLGMLAIAWTTAAVGEELLFRGFLQARLRGLLGAGAGRALLAALLQAGVFGLVHAYQGPTGVLVTGCLGLVFGLVRLRLATVWPLVLAHGLIDTLSLLALYAGAIPA